MLTHEERLELLEGADCAATRADFRRLRAQGEENLPPDARIRLLAAMTRLLRSPSTPRGPGREECMLL